MIHIEGIGDILRWSISATLPKESNSERLNMYLESFEDGVLRNSYGLKVKLAWATLHSLLHSERAPIYENGLLIRCKFLLDESELQHSVGNEDHEKTRLDKANVVIDIMSNALSLVAQINVTDRMNILKGVWEAKPQDNSTSETASMAALLLQGQAIVPMQLVARVPADLFYWPLIQLAAAATDNIALGVSVGSKGGGNLPGATSDIRSTLLLLLIVPLLFVNGSILICPMIFDRELLDDTDSRVAYFSSTFLLKSNNEKLLENPYLQMRGLLQLSSEGLWN
ncbi:hypothetical protein Tco_0441563 [Tanacetum coccineum]